MQLHDNGQTIKAYASFLCPSQAIFQAESHLRLDQKSPSIGLERREKFQR